MKTKFKPIRCPHCNRKLLELHEDGVFLKSRCIIFEDKIPGAGEVKCRGCKNFTRVPIYLGHIAV